MPSVGEIAGTVAFGVTGAGLALGVGAETWPGQRVGEATMLVADDSTHSQVNTEIDCVEAVIDAQELADEQVMPDPECAADPNQVRTDALEALGYPPEATAYASSEGGGVVGETPSHDTVLGKLVEAKEGRAGNRVRVLGGVILAATALVAGARYWLGGNGGDHSSDGHPPAPSH